MGKIGKQQDLGDKGKATVEAFHIGVHGMRIIVKTLAK